MKTDYRNLEGKVQECIKPTYLSGAGKPATVLKNTMLSLMNTKRK